MEDSTKRCIERQCNTMLPSDKNMISAQQRPRDLLTLSHHPPRTNHHTTANASRTASVLECPREFQKLAYPDNLSKPISAQIRVQVSVSPLYPWSLNVFLTVKNHHARLKGSSLSDLERQNSKNGVVIKK